MLTTGSKFCFGVGTFLLVAAVLYGWTTGGVDWGLFPGALGQLYFEMLGAVTLGWRGAIGDHLGYSLLVGGGIAFIGLGGVLVALRDADPEAVAAVARTPHVPVYRLPFSPNIWAPVIAFALGVIVLGLATSVVLVFAGLALLALAALEWAMQAWADRATGDPAMNARLRNRVMNPIEVPLIGAIGVAFVGIGVSRVLLAVSQAAAVWLIIAVATAVLLLCAVVAAIPSATRGVLGGLVVVGALGVLAAGIGAAAVGEREFEHHGPETLEVVESGEDPDPDPDAETGGEAPTADEGPVETEDGGE